MLRRLRELKQLNYSLDVQLRREQEERQTIERQLMALHGSRGGSTSPRPFRSLEQQERSSRNAADETDLNSCACRDLFVLLISYLI